MPIELNSGNTIMIGLESPPPIRLLWPAGIYLSPVSNALWKASFDPYSKDARPPQSQLLTKAPSHSRTSILYDCSTDYSLREQYRDPWNEVRIGKLLQDLDALAFTVPVKHCSDDGSKTRPLLLVTAAVHKIVLKKPISVYYDLKIVGSVIWVGRSSIEVQLEITTPSQESGDDAWDSVALTANFIFVARDCNTGKAAPVNRLSPETEGEKTLFKQAEARNKLRKSMSTGITRSGRDQRMGLSSDHHDHENMINDEDTISVGKKRIEALLGEKWILSDVPALAGRDSVLLRDTRLESPRVCQPQHRNMHGRIFGGFLMNRAFELAFSTAYSFAGLVPCFLEVDHVDFFRPVEVGDFVRFKSCVLYTQLENQDQPLINVEVVAHVTRPEPRSAEASIKQILFHFLRPEAKMMKKKYRIRNVIPSTEEEARRVVERLDHAHLFYS